MNNSHVLVTGAASGLGWGCVQRLAPQVRKITLCDIDADGANARLAQLRNAYPALDAAYLQVDLADPVSIDQATRTLMSAAQPVDVLVNNAGIFPPAQRITTQQGHELTFAIAHLGHFRLTAGLWPLLEAAPSAAVISVTSLVQKQASIDLDNLDLRHGYKPLRAYQQAKLACLLFALELDRRLQASDSAVRSYAMHPGVCRSQLGANRTRQSGDGVLGWLSYWFLAKGMQFYGQTPEQAAEPVEQAARGLYPAGSFLGPSGFLQYAGPTALCTPGPKAGDPDLAAALWQRTLELCALDWMPGPAVPK